VCTFDKVVIQGDGYVSTRALQYLAEANVNVIMLDKQGRLFSHVNQILGSDPLLRQRQYDTFRNEVKVNELRKWIMDERITSQIQLFKELVTEPKFSNKYNKNIRLNCIKKRFKLIDYSLSIKREPLLAGVKISSL
tara:strand:+ start:806 stop:1213 length:408 start_codon:yes stop_codon:yes gene_type:complete